MTSSKDIVNYLDVKLEGVKNLPPDWTEGMTATEGTSIYSQNPFRYKVSFTIPGTADAGSAADEHTTYTYENGRLLPSLPKYTQYIAAAAPPPLSGTDEVNPIRDFPETMGELQQTGETLDDPSSPQGQEEAPPQLLWAVTYEEAPPALPSDEKKNRKKGGSTVSSTVGKEDSTAPPPLPPLPDNDEQPPCVIRVPLTTAQERALESMVRQKKPLVMHLQRVLKPYVPADWEDMNAKYYEATIPISLDPFSAPGSVEAKEEVPLVPVPVPQEAEADRNPKKKTAARKAAKSGQPPTMYEEPAADVHPYLSATTTATVELRLRHTLTRLSSDRVRPALTPSQLIPTRSRTQTTGSSQSVSVDFEEAIKDMATHLLKEYYEVNPAEKNAAGDTLDEREARRVRFLDYFQSTGQVLAYKTKISGLVLRIIEEKFHTDPTATPEDVGKLQNELYVFLLEHMHVALQELIDADTARPTGGAPASDRVADSEEGEEGAVPADAPSNIADVWYQRAQEAEMTGELSLASSCHQSRIASYVGSSRYPEMWTDAAAFYTRIGDSAQAEVCYREAIACDPTYLPALLGYGMWLLTYERLGEAAIFLHSAVDLSPEDGLLWAIISLLNSLHIALLKEGSPNYTNEAAKWRREREDSIQQAVQRFKKVDPDATEEKALLRLANYALQLHHRELANICLCQCEAGKREVEIFYARLFVQAEQYREALHTLGELEETEVEGAGSPEEQDELNILRAECEAALGHTQQAITLYKKALCANNEPPAYLKRSQAVLPPSQEAEVPVEAWRRRQFLNAYVRVGNLLLGEGKYRDALGVFAILLQVWPSSLAWLGAGIAYYRSGNLENAEECLAESNVLDPSNPRTWGYLTLLVVRLQTAGVEDTLQQLRLHDLVDPALWAEIGKELLTSNHGSLAVWCLRRALYLDGRAAGGKSHGMHSTLTSTTQYYLAQALVEQREWEEAQELLESVAEHSPNEVLKAKAEEELHQLRSFST